MKFRAGIFMGMAAGYYLGAKAGRDRYRQLNQIVDRARRSDTLDLVGDKARAVVDLTMERARDLVDTRMGNGSEPSYSSSR